MSNKHTVTESVKNEKKEESNDPNVIKFSNNNGPETFTITHKT